MNFKLFVFPELKNFVLRRLPKLTDFYNTTGSATIQYPSLEHLYVEKCPLFSTHWIYLRTTGQGMWLWSNSICLLLFDFAFSSSFISKLHWVGQQHIGLDRLPDSKYVQNEKESNKENYPEYHENHRLSSIIRFLLEKLLLNIIE